ncbi:MAG: hypothetical protein GHCLOJNM_03428 [bacterium]|nr:hypothetical protein [bacterium]
MAAPSPTPVPPDPDTCVHDNHECNPFCDIHNFEGGELWRKIDTTGFKNVVVEFDLKAEGLSEIPHGYRPRGSTWGYEIRDPEYRQDYVSYLPWSNCQNVLTGFQSCVDCWLIEELVAVFFTTDYGQELYDGRQPRFSSGNPLQADGIDRCKVAKIIPRSVLQSQGYDLGRRVRLDFSMQDDTDDNSSFGIWIRAQVDSDTDVITIDNLTVKGQ